MKTLKIYQNAIIGVLFSLIGLNIYFIVRTIMMLPTAESLQDHILLLVCLFFLLAILVTDTVNTFISKTKGSAFIRALALNDDLSLNTKFIVFCYIFGTISIGVIIYFVFVLAGFPLYFASFPRPLSYLIINVMGLTLLASIVTILFPHLAKADMNYTVRRR